MRFRVSSCILGLTEESNFDKLVDKLRKRPDVKDPEALAASIGRKNGKIESDMEPSEPDTIDDTPDSARESVNGPAAGCREYDDGRDACMDESRHTINRLVLGLTESAADPKIMAELNRLAQHLGRQGHDTIEYREGSSAKTDVYTLHVKNNKFFEDGKEYPEFIAKDEVKREVAAAIRKLPLQISSIRSDDKWWITIVLRGK